MVIEILYSFAILGAITSLLAYLSVARKIIHIVRKSEKLFKKAEPKQASTVNYYHTQTLGEEIYSEESREKAIKKKLDSFKDEFLIHYLTLCENIEVNYGLNKYQKMLNDNLKDSKDPSSSNIN